MAERSGLGLDFLHMPGAATAELAKYAVSITCDFVKYIESNLPGGDFSHRAAVAGNAVARGGPIKVGHFYLPALARSICRRGTIRSCYVGTVLWRQRALR